MNHHRQTMPRGSGPAEGMSTRERAIEDRIADLVSNLRNLSTLTRLLLTELRDSRASPATSGNVVLGGDEADALVFASFQMEEVARDLSRLLVDVPPAVLERMAGMGAVS